MAAACVQVASVKHCGKETKTFRTYIQSSLNMRFTTNAAYTQKHSLMMCDVCILYKPPDNIAGIIVELCVLCTVLVGSLAVVVLAAGTVACRCCCILAPSYRITFWWILAFHFDIFGLLGISHDTCMHLGPCTSYKECSQRRRALGKKRQTHTHAQDKASKRRQEQFRFAYIKWNSFI